MKQGIVPACFALSLLSYLLLFNSGEDSSDSHPRISGCDCPLPAAPEGVNFTLPVLPALNRSSHERSRLELEQDALRTAFAESAFEVNHLHERCRNLTNTWVTCSVTLRC